MSSTGLLVMVLVGLGSGVLGWRLALRRQSAGEESLKAEVSALRGELSQMQIRYENRVKQLVETMALWRGQG